MYLFLLFAKRWRFIMKRCQLEHQGKRVGVRYCWGKGNRKEEMSTGSQSHTETTTSLQSHYGDKRITFGTPGSYFAVKLRWKYMMWQSISVTTQLCTQDSQLQIKNQQIIQLFPIHLFLRSHHSWCPVTTGTENTDLVLVFKNKVFFLISLLLEHTLSFKSLFKGKKVPPAAVLELQCHVTFSISNSYI